jgi:hypothetical protein
MVLGLPDSSTDWYLSLCWDFGPAFWWWHCMIPSVRYEHDGILDRHTKYKQGCTGTSLYQIK